MRFLKSKIGWVTLSLAGIFIILLLFFLFYKKPVLKKGTPKVFYENGKVLTEDNISSSDLQVVKNEAIDILRNRYRLTKKEALKLYKASDLRIYSFLAEENSESVNQAFDFTKLPENCHAAAVLTDINGRILATVSNSNKVNYCLKNNFPGSTFKPLGVYASAIENRVINWSSMIPDQPVKQVVYDGVKKNWPANYNNKYSSANVSVANAVKVSLNTVAVRVLNSLTPEKSIDFLERLKIDTSYEKNKIKENRKEDILSNLSLGYLKKGVSPLDLAGYYQIFANGGSYTEPYAVKKITCGDKIIYEAKTEKEKIISKSTSKIMNELLSLPVSSGGTAQDASINGIQIRGKTGTTEGYKDNWFVGFTPEYICSVWYGFDESQESRQGNYAVEIFKGIIEKINVDSKKNFFECKDVLRKKYCVYSGMLAEDGCNNTEYGFYDKNNIPDACKLHNGESK